MYVLRNNEVRWCHHCCCGKTINITYSKCVSVPLSIQHAMHMRRTVICGLSRPKIFFHLQTAGFSKKKKITDYKMCVLIFSTNFV